MSHLSHVVLHDVATGRVLLPSVQFVYEGEEVPPHVLQRARLLVHLALADGAGERRVEAEPTTRVAQIDPTSAETRVQDFYVSSDEATGETLHIEGFFPFEYVACACGREKATQTNVWAWTGQDVRSEHSLQELSRAITGAPAEVPCFAACLMLIIPL